MDHRVFFSTIVRWLVAALRSINYRMIQRVVAYPVDLFWLWLGHLALVLVQPHLLAVVRMAIVAHRLLVTFPAARVFVRVFVRHRLG